MLAPAVPSTQLSPNCCISRWVASLLSDLHCKLKTFPDVCSDGITTLLETRGINRISLPNFTNGDCSETTELDILY
ncbi:unnamed protein product [Allacma fusca]|uniref:Uncharacterized protein n=1 Tax=Allacma fusca TaxID=39272 RepID=A0A8J2P1S6_9HEXA|nr:unnamed protein product [Allacma fusca]